jgi:hypothetical protein
MESCLGFVLVGDLRPDGEGVEVGNITNGYPIAGKTEDDLVDIAQRLAKGKRWQIIYPGDVLAIEHDDQRTRIKIDAILGACCQ